MTKTKYWLSILAISVVLIAGSLAVSPIAIAGGDDDDDDDDGEIVPIGAVLDWFCVDPCKIPSGYALADGSTVDDRESPLYGVTLPDLRQQFVRGAQTTGDVGNTGGAESHTHSIDPPSEETTSDGDHSHDVDPPSKETTSDGDHSHDVDPSSEGTTTDGDHTHGANPPCCEQSFGPQGIRTNYARDNAVTSRISGPNTSHVHNVNIGFFTTFTDGDHSHSVDIESFSSNSAEAHTHDVDIESFSSNSAEAHTHDVDITEFASASGDNLPPFVDLLKIIRIK